MDEFHEITKDIDTPSAEAVLHQLLVEKAMLQYVESPEIPEAVRASPPLLHLMARVHLPLAAAQRCPHLTTDPGLEGHAVLASNLYACQQCYEAPRWVNFGICNYCHRKVDEAEGPELVTVIMQDRLTITGAACPDCAETLEQLTDEILMLGITDINPTVKRWTMEQVSTEE